MINKLMTAGLWLAVCSISTQADTIYFLVGDFNPAYRNDCYVLPLTEPNDITHARDLIANGPGVGNPLVIANITCGADNINRNFYSPSLNAWNWHITAFSDFADVTPEILDGNATIVNKDCPWWIQNTAGVIGFWSYTIVAELGRNPKPWQGNLNSDSAVNMIDMKILSQYWDSDLCASPGWCNNADINHDDFVNLADLALFADTWLTAYPGWPMWYSAWACAYQCHGDADCQAVGANRVTSADLSPLTALYGKLPVSCSDPLYYNPNIDFDRDCDIDQADVDIITVWYMKPGVPADCATTAW